MMQGLDCLCVVMRHHHTTPHLRHSLEHDAGMGYQSKGTSQLEGEGRG